MVNFYPKAIKSKRFMFNLAVLMISDGVSVSFVSERITRMNDLFLSAFIHTLVRSPDSTQDWKAGCTCDVLKVLSR